MGRLDRASRSAAIGVAILTPALWLLPLGYALYLLLLLDVALPAHSAETIAGLMAIVVVLLILHLALLRLRRRIFFELARALDSIGPGLGTADEERVQATVVGGGAAALSDAGIIPVLLALLTVIVGVVAVIPLLGASIIGFVLALSCRRARHVAMAADEARSMRERTTRSRGERLTLLGLKVHHHETELRLSREATATRREAAAQVASVTTRVCLVAGVTLAAMTGFTTWLVVRGTASHGVMAAALLLTIFVLEPLLRVAGRLQGLALAISSWRAIRASAADQEVSHTPVVLPPPSRGIEVEALAVPVHGTRRLMLQNVSFAASAGDVVAVIGPADVGKSTLLKLLGGQVQVAGGSVRLDGATLDQWSFEARARHIGYLPQLPDLLPGSVAQNIARFQPQADPAAITRAAIAAGAHDAIVRLPAGYDTLLGDADLPPPAMSVQQRIALARALFGDPFLLLLDTPNAFQDNDGDAALRRCLSTVGARGGVAIVVGDSAAIIDSATRVLVLRRGGMADFGTKDDVRARLIERRRRDAERLAAVPPGEDAQRHQEGENG